MKAIIIGANGQDGFYLSQLLKRENIELLCISRKGNNIIGDVNDYEFVEQQIKKYRPNYIFHLAANSTTKHETIFENHQTISTGTLNVLEITRLFCPEAKVFISGSAMQFRNDGIPISESTPFEATSPYSIARIQSVYAARYFRNKFGMKVYIGYFFNHDSPFRTERHVNQMIVKTIKRISEGSNENLELGNTHVLKEFNYAADVVEAVWVLLNQNEIFETVIGSGEAHSIQEWLEYCFNKTGMKWQDHVIQKDNFKSEYDVLVSDPTIIKSLGWKQNVSFSELADLMMSY
jgi:GDPmannose 4,6-dehydratase